MKVLITGARGQLAQEFRRALPALGHDLHAPPEESLDISNSRVVRDFCEALRPDLVINCAAYNHVDKAEDDSDTAYRANAIGPKNLALACREHGALLVHYSTDYVFDGRKEGFYTEYDAPNPINRYGETKLAGDIFVSSEADQFLIFRVSWVFGEGKQNFLYKISEWAGKNPVLKIVGDQISVPTYTEDIVGITMQAVERGLRGVYHLTSSGYCTRYELARYFLEKTGANNLVLPVPSDHFPLPAKRPYFSAMSNEKLAAALGREIPDWKNAVDRYIRKQRSVLTEGRK